MITFCFFCLLRTASRSREQAELAAAAGPRRAVCGFVDIFRFRELFLCRGIILWSVDILLSGLSYCGYRSPLQNRDAAVNAVHCGYHRSGQFSYITAVAC